MNRMSKSLFKKKKNMVFRNYPNTEVMKYPVAYYPNTEVSVSNSCLAKIEKPSRISSWFQPILTLRHEQRCNTCDMGFAPNVAKPGFFTSEDDQNRRTSEFKL